MATRFVRSILLGVIFAVIPIIGQPAVHAATPASFPSYQRLGDWAHVDVVYRYGTDETVTFSSDDYWAKQVRESVVASGSFGLRCFYPNYTGDPSLDCNDDPSQGAESRPGSVYCAFIQRYDGYWQYLLDYTNIGVGQSLIAVRDDGSTYSTNNDCDSLFVWTLRQNNANGFPPSEASGGGGGGGGGGVTITPPQHAAQHPPRRPSRCRPHTRCS